MLPPVFKKSQKEQVQDRLINLIVSGRVPVGQRLAPIKDLARRLRTSPTTVRAALIELAQQGYVEVRHGSGTYVRRLSRAMTLRDSAVLCGTPYGHVWADLMDNLTRGLSERGRMTTVFDVSRQELDAQFDRLLDSEADSLFIDGRRDFPHDRLSGAQLGRKLVIILVAWESGAPIPAVAHQVFSDFDAGGRCVAEHLFDAGHRRVLVTGPQDSFSLFSTRLTGVAMPLPGFVKRFTELGGTWIALPRHYVIEEGVYLDPDELAMHLFGDDPPTAVFGLRDIDVWLVQGALRRLTPNLADRMELVGYYNTPWSQAGHPPITSVDIDIEAIAGQALRIADSLWSGQSFDQPQLVQIQPRLIVRETSGKGPRR